MTELETLQKENKNLKELLEEVYEVSMLDDIIDDLCSDRSSDEVLLSHLSLKSQVMEALDKRKLAKEIKPLMTEAPKMADVAKLKHNNSKMVKYYGEDK